MDRRCWISSITWPNKVKLAPWLFIAWITQRLSPSNTTWKRLGSWTKVKAQLQAKASNISYAINTSNFLTDCKTLCNKICINSSIEKNVRVIILSRKKDIRSPIRLTPLSPFSCSKKLKQDRTRAGNFHFKDAYNIWVVYFDSKYNIRLRPTKLHIVTSKDVLQQFGI